MNPVSLEETAKLLKGIDVNYKYFGHDYIHPFLLENAAEVIAKPLTHIVNLSPSQGIFPYTLKIAKVILYLVNLAIIGQFQYYLYYPNA